MEQVKLLSMTAIVTVLIWAGADSLVNEAVIVRVTFEVVPLSSTDTIVEIEPADTARVYEVEVVGPRRRVEHLGAGKPLSIRLRVEEQTTGHTTIHLTNDRIKRALTEHSIEFRKLAVVTVQPETLRVAIDRMVTHHVDITLNRLTVAYEQEPQLEQPTATVRMRESYYDEMVRTGRRLAIDVASDLERLLADRTAGQTVHVSVPLDGRPFGPDAVLTPRRIDVTATVKADRATAEVSTVPIKPVVSFANLSKTIMAVGPDGAPLKVETRTIRVTGPSDAIASFVRGETRAYGVIHLKEEDFAELGVMKSWTPEFHLPPNIDLAEQPAPIEFKLIDATQADADGG